MLNMRKDAKALLAKLLAEENISIQRSNTAKTAMFDLKKRLLILPVWENVSGDLEDMLLGHETGHALDTPIEEYKEAVETISKNIFGNKMNDSQKNAIRGFLNVIEDARIDKRQKRRYPGLRRNYTNGYKELFDRNFFGTDGRDPQSFLFIDKVNLCTKGGAAKFMDLGLTFNPEEKAFLARIDNLETFPEVVTITEEIYRYSKQQLEEMMSQHANALMYSEDDGDGEDGDFFELDGYDYEDDEDGEGKSSNQKSSAGAGKSGGIPVSITNVIFEKKMSELVKSDDVTYVNINFPDVDWGKAIDDYKKVLSDWKTHSEKMAGYSYTKEVVEQLDEEKRNFNIWKMKENETVSFMVSEFERKKAADMYARTLTAKTGVLDTNRIHSYKYNEDLFKRISVVPKGKNHGFVMFLDWSGSMAGNLKETLQQLFSLCLFCKRIQVPFEVYAFNDSRCNSPFKSNNIPNCVKFGAVKLRNILSSRMTFEEINFACAVLMYIAKGHIMPDDALSGTPLHEAIYLSWKVVEDFRVKNKLEVVNTIFLTDGEGNMTGQHLENSDFLGDVTISGYKKRNYQYFYNDPITGKTYNIVLGWPGLNVKINLLKILKDRTQTNLVGFYLLDGNFARLRHMYGIYDTGADAFWKENFYYPVKTEGYDEYYIINTPSLRGRRKDDNMDLGSTDTLNKKISKEFTKFLSRKTVNRVLLRNFIKKVTGEESKRVTNN